jgi:Concanavalin A-like lectin/glucanases superfamily
MTRASDALDASARSAAMSHRVGPAEPWRRRVVIGWRVRRGILLLLATGCGRVGFAGSGDADLGATSDIGVDALPDGLIAYYPLDQLAGMMSPDASGHGHHATCSACPSVGAGARGAAALFDGTDGLVIAAGGELETTMALTIAVWLRVDALPSSRACPTSKLLGSGNQNSWQVCVEQDARLFGFIGGASGAQLYSTTTVAVDRWHHVAMRWDGAVVDVWLDGVLEAARDATLTFDGGQILIGRDQDFGGPASALLGSIDDVRIYNRALPPGEIATLAIP